MNGERSDVPATFEEVLRSIAATRLRGDVTLTETPAPARMAPFAVALNGEVGTLETAQFHGDEAGASGRFVVLHDPAGQPAWEGTLRVVALVKAEVEAEVGTDEVWAEVAWSWIREALADVPHRALGGTVTRTINESFGNLAARGQGVAVEMRVSWTPLTPDLAPHLAAWTDLLCTCAGVPPVPEGVTMLPLSGKAS